MLRFGRGRYFVGITLAVALVLAVAGCAGGGGHKNGGTGPYSTSNGKVRATVYWDLRESHSAKHVKWRGPSMFELDHGVQVKLQLPGATFQDRVDQFGAGEENGQISFVDASYPGATVSQAYAHARQLARKWHINEAPLDAWYANQKAHPSRPPDLPEALANSVGFKPTGPGGPITSLEINYSFDDSKPATVTLEFFWK